MNPIRRSLRAALALATAGLLAASAAPAEAAAKKAAHAPTHAVVPFIDDDLPRALAAAKQSDRPIFVESWAPW